MASKIDIYRAANLLIKQHGEQASIVAAMRADACAGLGDLEGARVWRRVIEAIEALTSTAPLGATRH